MFAYFLLGCGLLIGLLLLANWFATAEPKAVVKALRWIGGLALAGLVLLVVLGGARVLGFLLAPLILPLLMRRGLIHQILQRMKAMGGGSPGQVSSVSTRFLRMTLDHDTGAMEGRVLEGPFQGRELKTLTQDETLELWRLCCVEDEESARVLEAYLDRAYGAAWRQGAGAGAEEEGGETAAAASGKMTRAEALELLGLEEGCSAEEIKKAHHRLMLKVHPDAGGSTYLATKINEAKDLLLGK